MREYKRGVESGIIDIYFVVSFNSSFLEALITKHYGYELGKDDILNVFPCLAIDNGKQIIALMLYDDRGLYEYVWQKMNRNC